LGENPINQNEKGSPEEAKTEMQEQTPAKKGEEQGELK